MPYRPMRPALFAGLACAALLPLPGCGGGSDTGAADLSETAEPADGASGGITARNGPQLARDTLELATALQDLADLNYGVLVGASVETTRRIPDVLGFAHRRLRAFAGLPIPGTQMLGGIVVSETFGCEGGGRYTVAFDDADANGRLSTGDGATFTFDACASDGVVTNGAIGYARIELHGPAGAPNALHADFRYSHFRVRDAGIETTIEGSARHGITVTTADPDPLALDARTTISSMTYASTDGWRYTLEGVDSRAETDYGTSAYAFTTSGTLTDPTFGALTLATPTRFEGTLGQLPIRGVMTVSVADGSQVRLTALAGGRARVEVDANADGAYESSTTLTWSALNAP